MVGEKGEGGVWWVRRERGSVVGEKGGGSVVGEKGGSVVGEKGEGGVWWVRRERGCDG